MGVVQLSDLTESAVDGPFGANLKTQHYVLNHGVRVVRLQNLGVGYFDDEDKAFISERHAKTLSRHEVSKDDLIVAALGDDNHPLARACLYPHRTPGIVKADCFRFRLQTKSADHAYVMHTLNCPVTRQDLVLFGQGVTRDRINLSQVLKCQLRLPPLEEQLRIRDVLCSCDDRLVAEAAYRDKLKLQKRGLMHDLLTGRVRV